jgi:pyruvate carboxylase
MEKKSKLKTLIIEGTKYKTNLTRKYENRKPWVIPDEKKIYSFIPGTLVKINAKKGQKVRKGQILFVLEAMKMKNSVAAHIAGSIKDVYVKSGENVSKNQLILEFE